MVLVIAEQRDGVLNNASWEALVAAQQIGEPVRVAVAGASLTAVGAELAGAEVESVLTVDHPDLASYTPDGFVAAVRGGGCRHRSRPRLPGAYLPDPRVRPPGWPRGSARSLIADCVGVGPRDGRLAFVRPMFQGKFVADVAAAGPVPHFASFQIGTFRPDALKRGTAPAPVRAFPVTLEPDTIRQSVEAPFQEAKQAVDLTQAERIVAVGRGIKAREHLNRA